MMAHMNTSLGPSLCHCHAVRRNARFLTRLYDRHLAAANLSISQFSILVLVKKHPGIAIAELAEAMVMERTTLVRALKPLQAEGLIHSRAEGARSALRLSLSDQGLARVTEARPFWLSAQQEYEALVGAEQAAALRESLQATVVG
ncbi:MarR family transcriptional regulator [Pseudomonas sp. Leaf127]|nr:MarR family transcriptional regulator [Pseudomonas sp. Leaf127]